MTMTYPALRSAFLVAVTAVALSLATGCSKKQSNIPPSSLGPTPAAVDAPTASLTADPLAIDLGGSVVLNWRTTNATAVTIDGIGTVNPNGTQTVSPSNSTNFHLTAKGDGGTTEANVRVTVRVPAAPLGYTTPANGDMGSDAAFHAAVQDVFFDYDSYDLRPDAQSNAINAASYLTAQPNIKVVVGGYCDSRGSASTTWRWARIGPTRPRPRW